MPKISSGGVDPLRVAHAIRDAAERWSDADFPPRVRATAAIEARTGYTTPVVEYALDALFTALEGDELLAVFDEELGGVDVLRGWTTRGSRRVRALPAGNVVIVASDTTIGVAIPPLLFALCAGCEVLVKDREDGLVSAFVASLVEEEPALAGRVEARTWSGGADAFEDDAFAAAACVVAFGNDATLRAIRARLDPAARFIGYGHRASAGWLPRETHVGDDLLDDIARDLVLYDTEGCMSLHALLVERGNALEPEQFLRRLGAAVTRLSVEFPAGGGGPAALRAVTAARGSAAFRAALGRGAVLVPEGTEATLILEPEPGSAPPFAPRVLPIYLVENLDGALAAISEWGIRLEAVALPPGTPDAVAETFGNHGAARLARFGEMQAPSPAAHHGGHARMADFVRWIENEL